MVQRGNNKQDVFFVDDDRRVYLELLREQGRRFGFRVDAYAHNALCYAELNPVRAGMVKKAWDYPWSSAAAHCGTETDSAFLDLAAWFREVSAKDWKATLKEVARDKAALESIRRSTHTGRPLGSDSFPSKLEHALGRCVRALPVGRQKGWRKKKPRKRAPRTG